MRTTVHALQRALAVAAMILGFAGPILNPDERTPGSGPLLIVADASWASARDWSARQERLEALLAEAARVCRPRNWRSAPRRQSVRVCRGCSPGHGR